MPFARPAGFFLALLMLLCGAVALSRARPAAGQSSGCAVASGDLAVDGEEQAALDAINALRAESRLTPLGAAAALTQAAAWKSSSMAATGSFGHDDADRGWTQRIVDCGYRSPATENLAAGLETGREAVAMWRDSAVHRGNMLDPSARVAGIARDRGASGVWYWTAVFGVAVEAAAPDRPVSSATPAALPVAATTAAASTAAPMSLHAGATATVNAGRGDCLNLRVEPSKAAHALAYLPDGTAVTITAGPRDADGISWWQLDGAGWASGEFLLGGALPPPASR